MERLEPAEAAFDEVALVIDLGKTSCSLVGLDASGKVGCAEARKVCWRYIAPGKPTQYAFVESFNGRATSC